MIPNWTYRNKEVTELAQCPKWATAFIYIIEFNNGKKYVGYKMLYHKVRKTGKKRRVLKESNWKSYCGSIKDSEFRSKFKAGSVYPVSRRITKFTKSDHFYQEAKLQFKLNVLENQMYYNTNIMGKFFRGNINKK